MIISSKVNIIINPANIKHYQKFSQEELKVKDIIEVVISSLTTASRAEIFVKCDECGIERKIIFKDYNKYGYSNGEYLCKKCKLKKNNLEKFGVENVFQIESIKEKIKKTNLEKWGVEFVSQSSEIQEKIKKNNLEKFGVDHHLKNPDFIEKQKKTNLEKWGVENISQSIEVKEKKKKVNFNTKGEEKLNHNFEIVAYKTFTQDICNPIDKHQSGKEIKLFHFIKSIYSNEIIQNFRIERQEIDVYLPGINLGFEFNGIYWHSDLYKDKNFHLNKTKFFKERGIHVFHIWEDDWNLKESLVKSQIQNLLGKSQKIGARKCEVKEVNDISLIKDFLNQNHIQGWVNSNIKIGLFFNSELVSLMTFDQFEGRKKMNQNEWNLNRFCNKSGFSVVGGASKLLNFFFEVYNPKRIISYSDKDWSKGSLYERLGFEKIHESNPDYKYLVEFKRIHKSNFKKSITGLSESELDLPKVWDCGKIKWEFLNRKLE